MRVFSLFTLVGIKPTNGEFDVRIGNLRLLLIHQRRDLKVDVLRKPAVLHIPTSPRWNFGDLDQAIVGHDFDRNLQQFLLRGIQRQRDPSGVAAVQLLRIGARDAQLDRLLESEGIWPLTDDLHECGRCAYQLFCKRGSGNPDLTMWPESEAVDQLEQDLP